MPDSPSDVATRRRICVVLVASLVAAAPRVAASQDVLSRGARVRVTVPALGWIDHEGTLDDATADSIRVDSRRMARAEITKLEVARNTSNFLLFSGIGLAGGAALGAITCAIECPAHDSDISKGGFMLIYTGVAAGAGLVLGAVVGALTHRTAWVTVSERSIEPTFVPLPEGGLRLGVRVRM